MITPTTPLGVVFEQASGTIYLAIGDTLLPITRDQLKDLKLTVLRADRAQFEYAHAQQFLAKPPPFTRRSTDFAAL
jgi:hypothetical protein